MKLFKNRQSALLMASPYIAWAVIFLVVPLAMVIYYGVTDNAIRKWCKNMGLPSTKKELKLYNHEN